MLLPILDSPYGRGGIVLEARKSGTTKSDLLFLAAMVEEKLSEAGIVLEDTPRYNEPFQIDEAVFEQVLENEVKYYFNPRAKDYDINSVRSIYVIREDEAASSLEEARAVFVTSNIRFARAAWEYGQSYESSRDVSSVITDFSLANITWLKAAGGSIGSSDYTVVGIFLCGPPAFQRATDKVFAGD